MLERLVEFFQSILSLFQFWTVVDQYENGIVLRLGKFYRELDPGFHWVIPLGVDRVLCENVALETKNLGTQSLTTKDGQFVIVGVVLSYRIKDVKKFLLEVEDADSVLKDSTYGVVGEYVASSTWEEISKLETQTEIHQEIRKKAFRWGIEVVTLQFSDISKSKTIRLITGLT